MRSLIFSGQTEPDRPMVIRFITTREGVCFCSISANGGAFVVEPGVATVIKITGELLTLQMASSPGIYNTSNAIASIAKVIVSKETDDEVQS